MCTGAVWMVPVRNRSATARHIRHIVLCVTFLFLLPVVDALWWPAATSTEACVPESVDGGVHSALLRRKSQRMNDFDGELVDDFRRRSRTSSCWKDAVAELDRRCTTLEADEAARSRLALRFTACQLHHDGKIPLGGRGSPLCPSSAAFSDCVALLDRELYPVYVQLRLHIDTLCFYAQEEHFQERTELAVAMLERASSVSLDHMKELSAQSRSLVEDMEHSRDAQALLYAEATRTNQWLLSQHAEQEEAFRAVTVSINRASANVRELHESYVETADTQRTFLASLQDEVHRAAELQERVTAGVRRLSEAIDSIVATSHSQVERQQELMDNVAKHALRLTAEAEAHQQRFFDSHATILLLLERLFLMQEGLVSVAHLAETAMFYLGALAACILLTVPQRTAEARFLCAAVVTASFLAERCSHPALRELISHHLTLYRQFIAATLLGSLVRSAWRYETPMALHRRMLHNELQLWFGGHSTATPSTGWPTTTNMPTACHHDNTSAVVLGRALPSPPLSQTADDASLDEDTVRDDKRRGRKRK